MQANAVLGVDISKKKFDVCLLVGNKERHKVFQNNHDGFEKLMAWCNHHGADLIHLCLEATGCYSEDLVNGILGVMHKATQGLKYVDPTYEERRKAAGEEGLLWGAYHFGVGEKGKDQAEHFLEKIGDASQVLLALDIKENGGNNITPEQAEDFVNQVHEATGRLPLIYGSAYFLKDFATPTLTKCPLWIARWGESPMLPKGWNDWILWQYTDGQTGPEPHSVKIPSCESTKKLQKLSKLYHKIQKFFQSIFRVVVRRL